MNVEAKENWNLIVREYRENFQKLEENVQNIWEIYCSEIFGYKKVLKEIITHKVIKIGVLCRTIPDITLCKNGKDIFDIELKQYNMPFDNNMEEQFISYLDLLHISCGMIICNKIYLYFYNYQKKEKLKTEIDFKEDNIDGIQLIEILQKKNFEEKNIENFIKVRLNEKINIERIKKEITADLVRNLVEEHFKTKYKQEEIEKGLKNIDFLITNKNIQNLCAIDIQKSVKKDIDVPYCFEIEDFPMSPDFIIIKTTRDRVGVCNGNLYEATRYCWKVRYEKVIKYPYVLSVINKVVREVYKVTCWKDSDVEGRLEFIGQVADDEIRRQWINKTIPQKFTKKGMASPVLFCDMK